jgi:hypothetical protein
MRVLAGVLAAGIALAQTSSPDSLALLASLKTWAGEYDKQLQDFICV